MYVYMRVCVWGESTSMQTFCVVTSKSPGTTKTRPTSLFRADQTHTHARTLQVPSSLWQLFRFKLHDGLLHLFHRRMEVEFGNVVKKELPKRWIV